MDGSRTLQSRFRINSLDDGEQMCDVEDADVSEPGKDERWDDHPSWPTSTVFLLRYAVNVPEVHLGSSHA